jgi:hypothetical protein
MGNERDGGKEEEWGGGGGDDELVVGYEEGRNECKAGRRD